MEVTSLETIRLASMGSLATIPGFGNGDTITVRLRKPNMLTLIKTGKIPNQLLNTAVELFDGGKRDGKKGYSGKELEDICTIMTAFCEASLAEPTYKELTDAGVELTQEQMIFIFNYSQGGVKSLEPFREQSEDSVDRRNSHAMAVSTESVA
jgi:hypothetical protein